MTRSHSRGLGTFHGDSEPEKRWAEAACEGHTGARERTKQAGVKRTGEDGHLPGTGRARPLLRRGPGRVRTAAGAPRTSS